MNSAARFTVGSTAPIVPTQTTVLQLKQVISTEESSGRCPVERQRLIFKGRILNDDTRTLADYGIVENDQTVHLVKGSAPVSNNAPPTNTNQNAMSSSTPQSASAQSSPFQDMQRMMQSQQQPFSMQGAEQMRQQLLQNPEMTQSIMSSPMMQNLMSNPDFIRNMMDTNPQMRQVLESNPELRNMLDDPETMRRSMEMMRDPNAMRNAMRNQDLALSQIENIPGGFSALRRMYEDVQEPMMDAFSGGADASSSTGSSGNGNSSGSGAAGNAMPNPWGSSAPSNNAPAANMNSFMPPTSSAPNPWAGAGSGTGAGAAGGMMGMPGANPGNPMNLEQTISMLENPFVSQMMDQMMSDPAAMSSMFESNPMLRQMRESNPQVASMLNNPEMMRSMMNPDNLRAMSQMQSQMQQMGVNIPGMPPMPNTPGMGMGMGMGMPPPSAGGNNSPNPGMDFSTLLNQFQAASVSSTSAPHMQSQQRQQLPPEQRFHMQLQSLNDMGFDDNQINIRALTQTHGNVNRAVDVLLTGPPLTSESPQPSNTSSIPDGASAGVNSDSGADNSASEGSEESGDKKND